MCSPANILSDSFARSLSQQIWPCDQQIRRGISRPSLREMPGRKGYKIRVIFPRHLHNPVAHAYITSSSARASSYPKTHSLSSGVCSPMAAGTVVVFDFDKTIIDVDSDNWVVDELGFTGLFDQLLPTMPWNSLMDTMMKEVHANGKTIGEIERVLQGIPIHPRIVPAIKAAHGLGCDLRVVSDANVFFIETILKHLGIRECFSEINTNPGYVDEEGRLRILPFHDFHSSSHGCSRCPPNMCKSMIIERIQASMAKEGKKRVIYLGDGSGDFCPSLKLKAGDFMMPRKDFPAWELINQNRSLLEAEIHEWSNGEDLERILLHLINRIDCIEDTQFLAAESKFQAISMQPCEPLPKAIQVPF